MKKLAHKGMLLRGKIETDLEQTIEKGKQIESPLN
jgi:hypothetical protein